MMSQYLAGDAPWVVAAMLLAVLCLFLRRLAPTKTGEKEGQPESQCHAGATPVA